MYVITVKSALLFHFLPCMHIYSF